MGGKVERGSRKKGEVGDKVCDGRLMTCDWREMCWGIGGVDSVRGSRRDQPQGGRGAQSKQTDRVVGMAYRPAAVCREDDLVAAIAKPWEEQIVSKGLSVAMSLVRVWSVQVGSVRILSEEVGTVCLPWLVSLNGSGLGWVGRVGGGWWVVFGIWRCRPADTVT